MAMNVRYTRQRINTDKIKEGIVRVGWFQGVQYEDGTPVAAVARYNEFGALASGKYRIPPRPFMRPSLFANRAALTEKLRQLYRNAIKNGTSTTDALALFGEYATEKVRAQIDATTSPANSPVTLHGGWLRTSSGVPFYVEPKRGTHPLKDTGFLQDSVTYQVEEVFK